RAGGPRAAGVRGAHRGARGARRPGRGSSAHGRRAAPRGAVRGLGGGPWRRRPGVPQGPCRRRRGYSDGQGQLRAQLEGLRELSTAEL
ncbi:unnamed protein product, partial [Prorocentrum cordatum]